MFMRFSIVLVADLLNSAKYMKRKRTNVTLFLPITDKVEKVLYMENNKILFTTP